MRSGDVVVENATGQYTLDLHNERSKEIIRTHDPDTPLFLFISYDMPHYPVQAQKKYLHLYSDIEDETRKKYLAMVSAMDESIGDITNTLKVTKLFDDAIVVFFSDNGGQPMFGGNNWPLRGAKLTLWEGGIRSATVVTGGVITTKGYTHNGLFHITDWFPTLLTAAGLTPECGGAVMDGVDQWTMIKDGGASARQEIVCNLDIYSDIAPPISGRAAIRYGKYKLTVGFAGAMDSDEPVEWVKPSEMCSDTDDGNDTACSVYKLAVTGENPSDVQQNQKTKRKIAQAHVNDRRPRLFNIEDDPTEEHDLAHILPELTSLLQHRLESYIPQVALPLMPHPLPAMARGMDGVHSTGWCTTEQLEEQRRASLAHVERAQHGQTKATCGNP